MGAPEKRSVPGQWVFRVFLVLLKSFLQYFRIQKLNILNYRKVEMKIKHDGYEGLKICGDVEPSPQSRVHDRVVHIKISS